MLVVIVAVVNVPADGVTLPITVLLIDVKLALPPTVAISTPLYVAYPEIVSPDNVPKLVMYGWDADSTGPVNPVDALTAVPVTLAAVTIVADTLPIKLPLNAPLNDPLDVNVVAETLDAVMTFAVTLPVASR
jgi:hypothetical protein